MVTNTVESGLLNLGQQLFQSIANQPIPWLSFACELQSKSIWREAVTHAVGQFNKESIQEAIKQTQLSGRAKDIVNKKADQLRELSRKLQSDLLSYYPDNLQRTKTTGRADRDSIGRASYANDIMAWLGLTCWRHWLAQMVINDHTHNAEDMGWQFYKCVYEAGDSYLDREQMEQFHRYFPMSNKGEGVLENIVNQLKAHGRKIVEPAMRSYCQLDVERHEVAHMTCIRIGPNDYPWIHQEPQEVEEEDGDDDIDGTTANEDAFSADDYSMEEDDADGFPDDDSVHCAAGALMDMVNSRPMKEEEDEEDDDNNPFLKEIRTRGMDHPQLKEMSTRRIATLGGVDIGGYFDQYGGYVYPDDHLLH